MKNTLTALSRLAALSRKRNKTALLALGLTVLAALAGASAQADTYDWSGASDGDWHNDANWATITGAAVDPVFDNTTTLRMESNSNLDQYIRVHRTIRELVFLNSSDGDTAIGLRARNGADRDLTFASSSGDALIKIDQGCSGDKIFGADLNGSLSDGEIVLGSNLVVSNQGDDTCIFDCEIRGNQDLVITDNKLTLFRGINTFTVDSTASNKVRGSGLVEFDGEFRFDLASASTTLVESWQVIDVSSLNETFGDNFKVSSTNGDFTETVDGVWAIAENGIDYEFSEHTGLITVEPVAPVPSFDIDLANASTTLEDSWQVIDVSDLNEMFDDDFKVSSTNGDFTEIFDGVWAIAENGIGYEFSEHTGLMIVKPLAHWMSGGLGVGFRFRPHDVAETQGWVMNDTVAGINSIPDVRWVIFNLTDAAGGSQFLAPHSVLSVLDTQLDSPVFMPSERALFEEALDRFKAEGYKVIVYYATQGPGLLKHGVERAEDKVLGDDGNYTSASMDVWADYVEGVYGDSSRATLLRAHAEIVFAEYAERFGDRIDGWWFDQTQDGDNQLHYEIAKQYNPNTVVGMDSSPNIYNDYLKGHVSGENAADVSNLEMYVHPAEASPEGYVYSDEGHPNISHYFSPVGESYNGGDIVWPVDQAADWTDRMLKAGGAWTWNFDLIDQDFGTIRSDMLNLAIAAQELRAENNSEIILGDCNLDGVVDFADISAFIVILQSGPFLAQADCNQDGAVDFADIPAFIDILVSN